MEVFLRAFLSLTCIINVFDCNVRSTMEVQDLGGDTWNAVGTKPLSTLSLLVPRATVPGCIHTDWYRTLKPTKENNPYYRFNDVSWRPIAEYNWLYGKTFSTYQRILNRKEQWLVCEGLDTIANVSVNGIFLGTTKNMFSRHVFNVTGLLQLSFNQIMVSFESAIHFTNSTRQTLSYPIPPECPPDVQHGFCHANLIRKEQCSFSWDWGPGFATQGIWKPIYLLALDEAIMLDVVAYYDWDSQLLYVKVRFHTNGAKAHYNGIMNLFISELLPPDGASYTVTVNQANPTATITKKIPLGLLDLWWPNGQGQQKLYNVTVRYQTHESIDLSTKSIWFGFRKVELVQQPINGSSGLSFYFKINDRPVFAKGSNWIPADAFLNRLTKDNYTNLLQSAKDANMNMLRVWGGGVYESDEFYEIADRLGIMIWQDFMFACAMYPADSSFLQSVSKEVNDTLWRLKYHPSIVIWAGNNENEAALGTDWYNTTANFDRYKKDYVNLYVDTIGRLVSAFDKTRPYLTSSPTNGAETKSEGWVAKNPYDTHYGDTHYYNYNDDCLDWTKYPKTRFASEYGFQSWPSIETLVPVSLPEDLNWTSNFSHHRNHHADGNEQILKQISMHFNLPDSKDGIEEFENKVYLSQIMQALCYKSETEFYRRSRSEIVNGVGHTMGALYWQLNDIWQAPTWSSIEYGGKWKAVHYFAKKFFANVALSAYDNDASLTIYSLSDINTPIEPVTLVIEMHSWGGFDIIHTWENPIYITPQSSKMQYQESTGILLHYGGCDRKELCYFVIYLKEMKEVDPTFFYPVPFKDIVGVHIAKIQVIDVQLNKDSSNAFDITLSTSAPAFFVWLEATNISGRFSDNAFMFYTPNKTVTFYTWEIVTANQLKSSIKIKSLADVLINHGPDKLVSKKLIHLRMNYVFDEAEDDFNATDVQQIYWLDDISTQVTLGICGSFFLLICAILVAYVVTRSSGQSSDKPKSVMQGQQRSRKGSSASQSLFLSHEQELLETAETENSGGAFKLNLKNGYGHNAKNVEIRFYIR